MTSTILKNRWYLAGALAIALVASLAPNADAGTKSGWAANAPHTEINFSVNHFFTPVTGSFGDYEIDLDYDAENPEESTVEVSISVASIDTGNEKRDNHLRTADWFEADQYPQITFKSTSVRQVGDNQLVASGPLTIKGQSHQIELPITLLGQRMIPEKMQPMIGAKEVASFQAATSIDRANFGVGVDDWAGTMVVGGEVEIEILLEAHNS